MATSTTPQSLGHRNITSIGRGGRVAALIAGSALAVALVGVTVLPNDNAVGGNAATNVQQSQSALLDGPAFQTAIKIAVEEMLAADAE